MIDHISISVHNLGHSTSFYQTTLATIGLTKLVERPDTTGFGKKYPEFWLNLRPQLERVAEDSGVHIALRAASKASVNRFHTAALQAGARSDGEPGFRPEYHDSYYAAFVRDPDGNRIEVVSFVNDKA